MNEILKIFLSLSLSGSLLILVLLLCGPLFKNKVSKSWQYYIWLVVIIRLLLPFAPETSPIGSLFQTIDNATIQIDTADSPEQDIVSSVQSANTMATENDAVSQQEELSTDITSLTKKNFCRFDEKSLARLAGSGSNLDDKKNYNLPRFYKNISKPDIWRFPTQHF